MAYDEYGEATLDILEYRSPATPDDIFYTLNSYGVKGRQAYLTYLFYDVVFVIARAAPIIVVCAWSYRKLPESFRPGIWIPLVNMAADLLESLLLFTVIKLFPQRIQLLELLTTWVIATKKYSFNITLALMFVALLVGIYYGFHGILADSVVMDKDRQDKLRAREQVQDVLKRSAARQATAAAAGRSATIKKNS